MVSDRIRILRQVSIRFVEAARSLFLAGSGAPIWPDMDTEESIMEEGRGLIDDVDPDTDLWEWMNAVLAFLRFVHAMHYHAVAIDDEEAFNDLVETD